MNLKQLEAFVKVTESGSFSKAAKLLFLTQPTVSAHISSLEKELDSRLFVRNTKEVKLSEEGKQLYQYARQMVELEKEIEQVFSKDAHGVFQNFQLHIQKICIFHTVLRRKHTPSANLLFLHI